MYASVHVQSNKILFQMEAKSLFSIISFYLTCWIYRISRKFSETEMIKMLELF